ncbi:MAG: hypothetical protein CMO55_03280 [Verrucomicrobiales bacterium]|nr:hypothetical protein [Verrucomicrobiales bacterium]
MAILPRHLAGQPFRASGPILETLERPTFDTSAQQNALYDIAEQLEIMGETAQMPVPPADIHADAGAGLSAAGSAISSLSGIFGNIGELSKSHDGARNMRDKEEAHALSKEAMSQYDVERQQNLDRPETHPGIFHRIFDTLDRRIEKSRKYNAESKKLVRSVVHQDRIRRTPSVFANASRDVNNQALNVLREGLNRSIAEQNKNDGVSLLRDALTSKIISQENYDSLFAEFSSNFQAQGEIFAIENAQFLAEGGDLREATAQLDFVQDEDRRSEELSKATQIFHRYEERRTAERLLEEGQNRKALRRLTLNNADGSPKFLTNLSKDDRDGLTSAALVKRLQELAPISKGAQELIDRREISSWDQLLEFFAEKGEALTPFLRRYFRQAINGQLQSKPEKRAFFSRKLTNFRGDRPESLADAFEISNGMAMAQLPENERKKNEAILSGILDNDPEVTRRAEFDNAFHREFYSSIVGDAGVLPGNSIGIAVNGSGEEIFYRTPTPEELKNPNENFITSIPVKNKRGKRLTKNFPSRWEKAKEVRLSKSDADLVRAGKPPGNVIDLNEQDRRTEIFFQRKNEFMTTVEQGSYPNPKVAIEDFKPLLDGQKYEEMNLALSGEESQLINYGVHPYNLKAAQRDPSTAPGTSAGEFDLDLGRALVSNVTDPDQVYKLASAYEVKEAHEMAGQTNGQSTSRLLDEVRKWDGKSFPNGTNDGASFAYQALKDAGFVSEEAVVNVPRDLNRDEIGKIVDEEGLQDGDLVFFDLTRDPDHDDLEAEVRIFETREGSPGVVGLSEDSTVEWLPLDRSNPYAANVLYGRRPSQAANASAEPATPEETTATVEIPGVPEKATSPAATSGEIEPRAE